VTDSTPVVSSETGKFSTDIAEELISAAVESVEKHRQDGEELAMEPEVAAEVPAGDRSARRAAHPTGGQRVRDP